MDNKKSFLFIAGLSFSVVLIMILIKVLIGSETQRLDDRAFESATKQFVDARIYKTGENPFPLNAHFYEPSAQKTTIKAYRGQYVLLNFWATWCPGCVKELPSLQALKDTFEAENFPVIVIALSLDREKTQNDLVDFLTRYDIQPFALFHDTDKRILREYPVNGMPTTLLIDPEGNVVYEFLGDADWTDAALVRLLKSEMEPFMTMQEIKKSL